MARIELDNLSLTFKMRACKSITLKEFLLGKIFARKAPPDIVVDALKNVSFTVERGIVLVSLAIMVQAKAHS